MMTNPISVNDRVLLPDGRLGIVWKKILSGRAVRVFPYSITPAGEQVDWTVETYFLESLRKIEEVYENVPGE